MRIEYLMEVLNNRRTFFSRSKLESDLKYLDYLNKENERLAKYYSEKATTFREIIDEYDFLIELFEVFNDKDDTNE